jgi:hypothetical protein
MRSDGISTAVITTAGHAAILSARTRSSTNIGIASFATDPAAVARLRQRGIAGKCHGGRGNETQCERFHAMPSNPHSTRRCAPSSTSHPSVKRAQDRRCERP